MATKTHIAKQIVNGKVTVSKTECGLNAFQSNGRFNLVLKTAQFKDLFLNTGVESCCEKCLEKAKNQGRI